MGAILPIISLLVVVTLGLLITRIATVALTFTGLSRDSARFQARSAFTGVGFTTSESEGILEHPVRRRIIMILMLMGNAGFVTAVSSLMLVFLQTGNQTSMPLKWRILLLVCGLVLLWAVASSKWIDRQMSRIIAWALAKWTSLDIKDYPALLRLSSGYSVSELKVNKGDWVAGKSLLELRLADEGIHILGVRRADGEYIGAPTGSTYIRGGDTLVIYAQVAHLAELERRRADRNGDEAHEQRVTEQQTILQQQQRKGHRSKPRENGDGGESSEG